MVSSLHDVQCNPPAPPEVVLIASAQRRDYGAASEFFGVKDRASLSRTIADFEILRAFAALAISASSDQEV